MGASGGYPAGDALGVSYLLQFDLVEDLSLAGCPLCRGAARTGRKYLGSLMHEDINDAGVRNQLERSGGLCADHVLVAVQIATARGDTMGMALLTELLLDIGVDLLRREGRRRRRHRPRLVRRPKLSPCPACEAEAVIVNGYADLLLAAARQDHDRAPLVAECRLCLPHALAVLERARTESELSALREAWLRPTRHLRQLVAEAIRKQSYEHRFEPPGEEAGAWRKAVGWLVGDRCFGREQAPEANREPRRGC